MYHGEIKPFRSVARMNRAGAIGSPSGRIYGTVYEPVAWEDNKRV